MSYTCEHCGTRHETPEQIFECNREQVRIKRWTIGLLGAIGILILVIELGWNQYVYSDWRCAFADCRKVVP